MDASIGTLMMVYFPDFRGDKRRVDLTVITALESSYRSDAVSLANRLKQETGFLLQNDPKHEFFIFVVLFRGFSVSELSGEGTVRAGGSEHDRTKYSLVFEESFREQMHFSLRPCPLSLGMNFMFMGKDDKEVFGGNVFGEKICWVYPDHMLKPPAPMTKKAKAVAMKVHSVDDGDILFEQPAKKGKK